MREAIDNWYGREWSCVVMGVVKFLLWRIITTGGGPNYCLEEEGRPWFSN